MANMHGEKNECPQKPKVWSTKHDFVVPAIASVHFVSLGHGAVQLKQYSSVTVEETAEGNNCNQVLSFLDEQILKKIIMYQHDDGA